MDSKASGRPILGTHIIRGPPDGMIVVRVRKNKPIEVIRLALGYFITENSSDLLKTKFIEAIVGSGRTDIVERNIDKLLGRTDFSFKSVNGAFEHNGGDVVIKVIAAAIYEVVGGIAEEEDFTPSIVDKIGDKINEKIKLKNLQTNEHTFGVSVQAARMTEEQSISENNIAEDLLAKTKSLIKARNTLKADISITNNNNIFKNYEDYEKGGWMQDIDREIGDAQHMAAIDAGPKLKANDDHLLVKLEELETGIEKRREIAEKAIEVPAWVATFGQMGQPQQLLNMYRPAAMRLSPKELEIDAEDLENKRMRLVEAGGLSVVTGKEKTDLVYDVNKLLQLMGQEQLRMDEEKIAINVVNDFNDEITDGENVADALSYLHGDNLVILVDETRWNKKPESQILTVLHEILEKGHAHEDVVNMIKDLLEEIAQIQDGTVGLREKLLEDVEVKTVREVMEELSGYGLEELKTIFGMLPQLKGMSEVQVNTVPEGERKLYEYVGAMIETRLTEEILDIYRPGITVVAMPVAAEDWLYQGSDLTNIKKRLSRQLRKREVDLKIIFYRITEEGQLEEDVDKLVDIVDSEKGSKDNARAVVYTTDDNEQYTEIHNSIKKRIEEKGLIVKTEDTVKKALVRRFAMLGLALADDSKKSDKEVIERVVLDYLQYACEMDINALKDAILATDTFKTEVSDREIIEQLLSGDIALRSMSEEIQSLMEADRAVQLSV